MKKIIIIIFLFLNFFLLFNLSIYGQENNSTIPSLPFIDNPIDQNDELFNCGIASDNLRNKCCNSINYNQELDISSSPEVGILEDNPPNEILKTLINFILRPINTIFNFISPKPEVNINPCIEGKPSIKKYEDPNCICLPEDYNTATLCDKYLKNSSEYEKCVSCSENKNGIWTAIGCVDGNFNNFVSNFILNVAISLAGGFALLCIIYSAFQIQSSQGNTEKIKKAQELLTSCIIGLILIIFSIFILRLISVNILKIPGFK